MKEFSLSFGTSRAPAVIRKYPHPAGLKQPEDPPAVFCGASGPPGGFSLQTIPSADSWLWWHLLFSLSVMSNSLRPHGLQQARLPCPSQSPGVCSNFNHLVFCLPLLLLPSVFPSNKKRHCNEKPILPQTAFLIQAAI